MRRLAVSVDTDGPEQYRAIYGLPPRAGAARGFSAAWIPRARELAERHGLALSVFLIADQLEEPETLRGLGALLEAGHAIECHTRTHPYHLTRLTPAELDQEIAVAFDLIERALGARPRGFRAPGYLLSEDVLDAVERAGARFDSSVLACPPYYLAKLTAVAALALVGRSSASRLDDPRVLGAPRRPYRPGRSPYAVGERALVELPIGLATSLGIPLLGTLLGRLGPALGRGLARLALQEPLVHASFHAIDFVDREEVPAELRRLPELRVPLANRIAAFDAFLAAVRGGGALPARLDELAFAHARAP